MKQVLQCVLTGLSLTKALLTLNQGERKGDITIIYFRLDSSAIQRREFQWPLKAYSRSEKTKLKSSITIRYEPPSNTCFQAYHQHRAFHRSYSHTPSMRGLSMNSYD